MPPRPIDRDSMMARVYELEPQIDPIHGWLVREAGNILYQLVRVHMVSPLVVELGSWRGRSTAWLASAAKDRGDDSRVIAVDTWAGTANEEQHQELLKGMGPDQLFEEFQANMKKMGVDDIVEPWRMTTIEAARRWTRGSTIGLLHIDASHEYLDVRADFEHWAPFVAPGGFIVFDDVPNWRGPSQLISELPRWFEFNNTSPNQWCVRKRPN
jgi:MMP 1-O-methyltransferase